MQITNYFDFKFILNLSISITVSLFIVFVFGKAVGDSLSEIVKYLLKNMGESFLKNHFPVKFTVGFTEDRISPNKFNYSKHKVVNFGKLIQTSLPGYGIDIFIIATAKLPFLYEHSKIRVQLLDTKDILDVYSANKLPGKPTTYSIGEIEYENNIMAHIHIDFKPRTLFNKYQIPIYIFFQGKLHQEAIELTVTKEK